PGGRARGPRRRLAAGLPVALRPAEPAVAGAGHQRRDRRARGRRRPARCGRHRPHRLRLRPPRGALGPRQRGDRERARPRHRRRPGPGLRRRPDVRRRPRRPRARARRGSRHRGARRAHRPRALERRLPPGVLRQRSPTVLARAGGRRAVTALRLGTRASLLARTQAGDVADALTAAGVATELVPMTSHGDTTRASLASLGGTGVFAAALREALLAGECDAVVHSYKDLPTAPHPGLRVAATPARADHRDVLCAASPLAELREGARVGTGSPRRRAQLLAARPDLEVVDIRGNVDTRLAMVTDGELDGVVLAMAGLSRIGREEHVAETFE